MKRIKHKVKAIIFDMDGTIIKTEHLWEQATQSILNRRGFKVFTQSQHEFLGSLSGVGLIQSAKVLRKEFGLVDSVEHLSAEMKMIAHQLFESGLEFIDGFEQFHKKLQKLFISTSVATNATQSCLDLIERKMNLKNFFGEDLYSIEAAGNKAKPDPSVFLHAAEKLKVKPHECVVFEDSIFGFQAANAAGMRCIAIKSKTNENSLDLAQNSICSYHEAEEALIKVVSSAF